MAETKTSWPSFVAPPAIRKISHTARLAVPVEGREAIEVPEEVLREAIEEGFDHTASDPFPHLILSYVALKLDLKDEAERATWERLVEAVGVRPHRLWQ